MWKDFKKFAFKGNVLDMAVGVIIGGAFGKIVSSLVNDIIMPFFGFITAGMDFNKMKYILSPAEIVAGEIVKPEAAILYGSFIQNIIDFLIIAFSIFIAIKVINRKKDKQKKEEIPAAPAPTETELLAEIRDLLKDKK
ncbi:large-conductance mechanosensitive channel protein MscL [Hydrogenoanaerobacterium sp.]|uniref:large-conductance mechanosensitive channel protein MscL n=1 Tax=Hydrogenoanaerobacterium sp. TaxID=2953763 RepID=UPI00289A4A70|nr:large-conductance mechanosensitive channel protein MscL [Hydrogenoanaerobacterium sp.]